MGRRWGEALSWSTRLSEEAWTATKMCSSNLMSQGQDTCPGCPSKACAYLA